MLVNMFLCKERSRVMMLHERPARRRRYRRSTERPCLVDTSSLRFNCFWVETTPELCRWSREGEGIRRKHFFLFLFSFPPDRETISRDRSGGLSHWRTQCVVAVTTHRGSWPNRPFPRAQHIITRTAHYRHRPSCATSPAEDICAHS